MEKTEPVSASSLVAELQLQILTSFPWAKQVTHSLEELVELRSVCGQWDRLLRIQSALIPLGESGMSDAGSSLHDWPKIIERVAQFFAYTLSLETVDPELRTLQKKIFAWIGYFCSDQGFCGKSKLDAILALHAVSFLKGSVNDLKEEQLQAMSEFIPLGLSLRNQGKCITAPLCVDLLSRLSHMQQQKTEIARLLPKKNLTKRDNLLTEALCGSEVPQQLLPQNFDEALERVGVSTFLNIPALRDLVAALSQTLFSDDERSFLQSVRDGNDEEVITKRKSMSQPILSIGFLCALCWEKETCAHSILQRAIFNPSLETLLVACAVERNILFLDEVAVRYPTLVNFCAHACKNHDVARLTYLLTVGAMGTCLSLIRHEAVDEGIEGVLEYMIEQLVQTHDFLENALQVCCAHSRIEMLVRLRERFFVPFFASLETPERRAAFLSLCLQLAWSTKRLDVIQYLLTTFKVKSHSDSYF